MGSFKHKNQKICATCQIWGGARGTDNSRNQVMHKSDQDKGECIGGPRNRQQTLARDSCIKWEKWSALN
jgi:hypothetical protein